MRIRENREATYDETDSESNRRSGEVYDDPSEDALFMFIEDLDTAGAELTVERTEPGRGGEIGA